MSINMLDVIIGRLKGHFHEVRVGAPVNDDLVGIIEAHVPNVPADLLLFYQRCNGVKVGIDDSKEGEIFDVKSLVECYPIALDADLVSRFLPLRGDGCGDYDCLVAGSGIGENAVIFWDHEVYEGPDYLLGSSIWSYLDMWSDYLIHKYRPDGVIDPRYIPPTLKEWPWLGNAEKEHPWPFDEKWVCSRDPDARELLDSSISRKWLLGQDNLR